MECRLMNDPAVIKSLHRPFHLVSCMFYFCREGEGLRVVINPTWTIILLLVKFSLPTSPIFLFGDSRDRAVLE